MDARTEPKTTSRKQLLEKLVSFEVLLEAFHPESKRLAAADEIAELQRAAEDLRHYLATHISLGEMVDWYELPDTDSEITAFASEMQAEHQEILHALGELRKMLSEMEGSLDRLETRRRIWKHGHALADRIARHTAGEATSFGRSL